MDIVDERSESLMESPFVEYKEKLAELMEKMAKEPKELHKGKQSGEKQASEIYS